MAKWTTVDDYIDDLSGWQKDVVSQLRVIVREAAPNAEEAIKWSQPVYSTNGPFCYFKAFGGHVNFGFWRGVDLEDPKGLLQGDGERMRHVKLTSTDEVNPRAFRAFVKDAVRLNQLEDDPTR